MTSIPDFFLRDEYFVDEKVRVFGIRNEYKVFDNQGLQIGFVKQVMSNAEKFLTLLINKSMMPFVFEIQDAEERVITIIRRGWTIWMSKIEITTADGVILGYVRQRFQFFKPLFEIHNANGEKIAQIQGDFFAWNFTITNNEEKEIGKITKKWAGVAKEFFTSADKYLVSIDQSVAEDTNKIAILSAAITIDMLFKENSN
jgi:uncharacterized protein YxjI